MSHAEYVSVVQAGSAGRGRPGRLKGHPQPRGCQPLFWSSLERTASAGNSREWVSLVTVESCYQGPEESEPQEGGARGALRGEGSSCLEQDRAASRVLVLGVEGVQECVGSGLPLHRLYGAGCVSVGPPCDGSTSSLPIFTGWSSQALT